MRVTCTQCGAELRVTDLDFLLRCPSCEARLVVETPPGTVLLARPVLCREDAVRRLPSRSVLDARLQWFPFVKQDGRMIPAFSQPRPELEGYQPPAAALVPLQSWDVQPEQLVPMSSGDAGWTVYHPFWVITARASGYPDSLLVDAVGGGIPGGDPRPRSPGPPPGKVFLRVLLPALAASSLSMLLLGPAWSVPAAVAAGAAVFLARRPA